MPDVRPYSIEQAQDLVEDAKARAKSRHSRWRALEALYRTGMANESIVSAGDVPDRLWEDLPGLTLEAINLVLPHVNIIKATMLAEDPGFLVEPYGGGEEAEQRAIVGRELLDYFWKRLRGTEIARDMVQDTCVLGCGFAKIGWEYEEGEPKEKPEEEFLDELEALVEWEADDAFLEDREPKSLEKLRNLIDDTVPNILKDDPFFEYVSPYDIFVPTNARRLGETRWIAQRIILPYDEVVANEAYRDEAKERLQPADRRDRPDKRGNEHPEHAGAGDAKDPSEDPFAEATLYEFYDMRSRRLLVFSEDSEEPLFGVKEGDRWVGDELPYDHRHPPFVMMRNFEDGGTRFWPFGDVENVAAIQAEFNEYTDEQLANARRAGNKYAIDRQYLGDDTQDLIESDQSDIVVPLDLNGENVNDVIQALQRQGLSPDVYAAKNELPVRMKEVMGLNDFQTGGTGADRMTATTAAVVDGTASLRLTPKKISVERAISDAALQILLLCQENLDNERSLRITHSDGAVEWLDVRSEDIIGEYEVRVESGSTQAVNPATRQARAVEIITNIVPQIVEYGFDPEPLLRMALRDYGLDPDRILVALQPQNAPLGTGEGEDAEGPLPGGSPPTGVTVPQEEMGGPPVPAAVEGGPAL